MSDSFFSRVIISLSMPYFRASLLSSAESLSVSFNSACLTFSLSGFFGRFGLGTTETRFLLSDSSTFSDSSLSPGFSDFSEISVFSPLSEISEDSVISADSFKIFCSFSIGFSELSAEFPAEKFSDKAD